MDNSSERSEILDRQSCIKDFQAHSVISPSGAPNGSHLQGRRRRYLGSDSWPHFSALGLTERERKWRLNGVGGSDANVILGGDQHRILALWEEKRGERSAEDLSNIVAVALGNWTEPFNRQWYQHLTGRRVERVGKRITCAERAWRRCTIDGFVEELASIWEAKHTNAFATGDQMLERYMPQLQHNMAVARASRCVLSVIFGNHKYEILEVAADWLYQQELFEAERRFWNCVISGKEPVATQAPPSPRAIGTREICLEGNNSWASAAVDWLQHREAAKTHSAACGTIKGLIEADVSRAFGHGIEAKRSKSGAITIREFAA